MTIYLFQHVKGFDLILYDKKSNFLGMSQTELFMLGFEDMEEFKSYHDDFANLFVEKPGYIFNFKNFSWIDYALHSGAPNKNVILKHKNGTEIEAKLNISEIYLIDNINESNVLYNIEIINSSLQKVGSVQPVEKHIPAQQEKEPYPPKVQETSSNTLQTDNKEDEYSQFLISSEMEKTAIENDTENIETIEDDFKLSIDNYETLEETPVKTDEDILKKDEKFKLKIDSSVINDYEKEEISIKTQTDTDNLEENNVEFQEPDFIQLAEETGLDLATIANLIEDFIMEAKEATIKIRHSDQNRELIEDELLKLLGISNSLRMDFLAKTLENMLTKIKKGDLEISENLKLFGNQIKQLEESLS